MDKDREAIQEKIKDLLHNVIEPALEANPERRFLVALVDPLGEHDVVFSLCSNISNPLELEKVLNISHETVMKRIVQDLVELHNTNPPTNGGKHECPSC